jgi:hypothetical protein
LFGCGAAAERGDALNPSGRKQSDFARVIQWKGDIRHDQPTSETELLWLGRQTKER